MLMTLLYDRLCFCLIVYNAKFVHYDTAHPSLFLPNVSFSPESGGSVKPNKAMEDISTHGTIKLKK